MGIHPNVFQANRTSLCIATFGRMWSDRNICAFRVGYGPEGEWVDLFRRDPEYICTKFLGDRNNPTRFMTIDFWSSREARMSFRDRFWIEFEGTSPGILSHRIPGARFE